ncbi:uncharacterized protein LOC127247531 [Andrographis paniculata]|uniref:uncharacterized protein LOC127247531 n=1 Tax=Andrographis paniculata TaxID=175694 RepID=UPI0021E775D2|nr:uncharacterized protein LOC127247531 [Andrographis paniculata]
MESAAEAKSESVGEKRPAEDWEASPAKRVRAGSERSSAVDVKKVAEMVLVLAAMGKMRGGKGPTDVEKELMAEARNRLAKVCEGFAPKEVFPRDAFGSVIEDLGLNKLKDQRLGFRPPKISIAEKLLVSKRKMEEAESFSLPSTPHSARPQGNSASVDNRAVSHPVRMSQPDKSGRLLVPTGNFQSPSPLTQGISPSSTSLPYQLPTSEIRPVVSSALSSSHLTSTALPRVDKPQLRSDGRPNGPTQLSHIPATFSASASVRTPTWSLQAQGLASKSGSDNKVPANMSLKFEGAAGIRSGIATQTTSRTVAQAKGAQPSQAPNSIQPPSSVNTHAEIGKIVQKLLQPKVLEQPTWNPPSTDYMNKALTCQICMSTVTEIDSILICDACEKGYHLKCLQASTLKGIPRGEWHCGKCLSTSNGKPLPPKYGRVMRNVNTQKLSSNTPPVPPSSSRSINALNEKASQPKVIVNGNTAIDKVPGGAAKSSVHQTSMPEGTEASMQENYNNPSMSKMDMDNNKISIGSCADSLIESSNSAAVASAKTLPGQEGVDKVTELKPSSPPELVMVADSSDKSQESGKAVEASQFKQLLEDHLVRDSKESHGDETTSNLNPSKEQGLASDQPTATAAAASNGTMNPGISSSDGVHVIKWVDDPIQILDEKIYYGACCINGHVYKLMDHVLIRFDKEKLIPSKLQAMWEDKNTTTKWVIVNQCYFPNDLPEAVGRPCGLESSEVYESTRGRALMAGLIEGPCEVLTPRRFAEETERRAQLGKQSNDHLPPLYLCKWIYDEVKGLFRDISC